MITGELKNKINALWEIFWTGGITNPLDVVEQMTYLMFIHDLDETDNLRAKESAMLGLPYKSMFGEEVQIGERTVPGNQLKWSVFHDFPAGKMYTVVQEQVFPFIKNLHGDKGSAYAKYMDDAIFKIPTPLMLDKVVTALDEIYAQMAQLRDGDVRGDVYEFLLSKIATAGVNGQFRTPRHIIKMMVELMAPGPDEVICDPACGTSGFLVAAGEYLKANRKEEIFFNREKKAHYMNAMFHGFDMDRTMLRIGAMNMMTHGVDNPTIEYRDSLSDQNPDREKYSLILANPPFKGSLDADIVSADLLKLCKTKKTELLFLALFLKMLKVGGRCACIVPDGVLFGSSKAHRDIRRELVDNHRLEAVISMPSGVFKPYAGVSTGVLIFTKTGHGGTGSTICGRMASPWMISGPPWRRTTSPISSPGSMTWPGRRPGSAPSSPSWCPGRRLWRMATICPSTSTKRPSMSPWSTRPPVRFSPSCGSWRRRFRRDWRNWRGWCDGEIGGHFYNIFWWNTR